MYGYPGAAFVDASGTQLGPDPVREGDAPSRVVPAPGDSAWSGLSYTSPEITAVRWTGGEVPVAGNESEVSLTVLRAGTGP
ncbi:MULTISPECIES: DUF4232 domain-containing protein [unclassified Streptomyces]|uniref:DUF4232 domain-containing protein n=1 Tax=unclassified Streptomyces TaxID=2593676 RepID=UPI001487DAB9|nr:MULTISPECIES: DUF4232 domain-containing protein [unclassified Streptomyces]